MVISLCIFSRFCSWKRKGQGRLITVNRGLFNLIHEFLGLFPNYGWRVIWIPQRTGGRFGLVEPLDE